MGHVKYMGDLYDKGILYMAGPFMDDSGLGAGIVMADSEASIRSSLEQDPGYQAGVFKIESIHPWWPAFNKPAGQRMTPEMMMAMMSGGDAGMSHGGAASGGMGMGEEGAMAAGNSMAPEAGGMPDMALGGSNFIEFPSKNVDESKAFYSQLFGWDFDEMAGDPAMAAMAGKFIMFSGPGGLMGAFTTDYTPTMDGPVLYINCNGVAAKLAEIEAAGGKTVLPSMQLPGDWGYIGHFTDPHGNRLGLWSQQP
jgi:predicted enzyme related to lactoylglutathione lyase/uncharacterized protein YciI